jgi:hypothetical protein
MRAAASLLSSARSVEGLGALVEASGLATTPVGLETAAVDALGVCGADVRMAAGPGAIRVLLLRSRGEAPLREFLHRAATGLAHRAPHVLWLLAACNAHGSQAALTGWSRVGRSMRFAYFGWETAHVVDSDAETLCALTSIRADEDVLRHGRCVDVLGRDALTRRFYRLLEAHVCALAGSAPATSSAADAREVALLYVSRLLFLCFLEAKGWLDGDRSFMANHYDRCVREGGGFHRRVLLPLFFGTLNTPRSARASVARSFGQVPFLNGGLFSPAAVERRVRSWRFPDDQIGALFEELFQRFRFVAREDSATWSEAAVDPEMLGRAFESLMASTERKSAGVFYTPHPLVAIVADHALASVSGGDRERLRDIRVLDPACGSGAFLVYVLERLADLRRHAGEDGSVASLRRRVLARSIFGVDRNPTAVWLCELRLWLSVVIESEEADPLRVPALPNLDRNIRVGDALAGRGFERGPGAVDGSRRMVLLRDRYMRATGKRKQTLARALDLEERRRALHRLEREIDRSRHERAEYLALLRSRDLFGDRPARTSDQRRDAVRHRDTLRDLRSERRRLIDGGALPFFFGASFADAQAAGGFDVVLGNPPWVRLHRIPEKLRQQFKRTYEVYRAAAWQTGARSAGVSPGFAAQVDLAALFVERSLGVLRPGGTLALLLPVKLWHSLAAGGVRSLVLRSGGPRRLEDLSASKHTFDAAVYPSLLVADGGARAVVSLAVHRDGRALEWEMPTNGLPFDDSPGAPWIILPRDARDAFDRLRAAGPPLATTPFGAPRLGVKSGCNAAFVVRVQHTSRELATVVDGDGEEGKVELDLLRPALRGNGVSPWTRGACDEWMLWTHDERGPLARLPDHARAWLRRRYGELATRSDATRSRRWWSLFRTDAADRSLPRVVWADFGVRPRALVLARGDSAVPLNSCYVVRCTDDDDAWALATLLNSPPVAAWLNALAEPARGGYRRYLGWTVGQLPIPRNWVRARELLASMAATARSGNASDDDLTSAVLRAYELRSGDMDALLSFR